MWGVASTLYVYRGDQVAHRLAATAAGMHSLVLGEAQIQGQIRTALKLALSAGTAGARRPRDSQNGQPRARRYHDLLVVRAQHQPRLVRLRSARSHIEFRADTLTEPEFEAIVGRVRRSDLGTQ
jgi:hypothetical protein